VKVDPALSVAAVGDMVKVDPVSGWILTDGEGYRQDAAAPAGLWDAKARTIRLAGAANEVVACQLILRKADKDLTDVKVSFGDLTGPGRIAADPNVQVFRVWYVPTANRRRRAVGPGGMDRLEEKASGWYGDACLPLKAPFADGFDLPAADNAVRGQRNQSVWVDLYVPRGARAGLYRGEVTITADRLAKPVKLPVRLTVLPVSLPDRPTFGIELNRYHDPVGFSGENARRDPAGARRSRWDYYRLAHRHRATLNALPYSHSGRVNSTYIPVMEGTGTDIRIKDWTDFDLRFGPLLDGSAFSAKAGYVGPGQDVPISHMYMAFHEAWPIPVNKETYTDWMDCTNRLQFAEYAKKARRPDVAFTRAYRDAWRRNARQYFEHFQYYWKVAYFGGQGRGGASFWLMDEPSDFDDYDANGFVMRLALQAHAESKAPDVKVAGRRHGLVHRRDAGLLSHHRRPAPLAAGREALGLRRRPGRAPGAGGDGGGMPDPLGLGRHRLDALVELLRRRQRRVAAGGDPGHLLHRQQLRRVEQELPRAHRRRPPEDRPALPAGHGIPRPARRPQGLGPRPRPQCHPPLRRRPRRAPAPLRQTLPGEASGAEEAGGRDGAARKGIGNLR